MKEIEVKILEVDREKVVEKLTALKATKFFDDEILTMFFDFSDNRIAKRKDVCRIRKMGDTVELTYKKVNASTETKEAEEFSVQTSDSDATRIIIQNLGLSVTRRMQKHRISYKLGNSRFDIDRYEGEYGFIPEFLEIEGSAENIKEFAKVLGFTEKDCLPWSTDELIRHYTNKK